MLAKDPPKVKLVKENHQELNSVRARYFLCTLRKRRFSAYIVVKSEPRSLEYKSFPCRGDLELRFRDFRVLFPYRENMNV